MTISKSLSIQVLILGLAWAGTASALPMPNGRPAALSSLRPQAAVAGMDFSGTVRLDDCSGALVRFSASAGSDPAMVLTNGHCYEGGFINAGDVVMGVPSSRSFDLLSADGTDAQGIQVQASSVVYATMTGTDITIYALTQTFDQIQSQYGVQALILSSQHPTAGLEIAIPSSYWQKIYSCKIDTFIPHLHEDQWTWNDSIRYLQPGCETIPGTSGSPIVDVATHEIVGINNTGNESGEQCTLDNPCEIDAAGNATVIQGAAYGEETYLISQCVDAHGKFDLNQPNCQLLKAHSLD